MRECELELSGYRRAPLTSQEALSYQCVHDRFRVDACAAEGARPEDLPDDRSRVEVCLFVSGQAIEASADDALQRLGEWQVLGGASLEVQLGELLGVEGVAAGAFEQGLLDVGRQHRAVEQGDHQPGGLNVGQRLERDRRGIELAATPVRAPSKQLGSGRADHQHRHVGHPVGELVDEVEQALVSPLEILEDEDQRTLRGELLEEAPPGREGLRSSAAPELRLVLEPGQRAQASGDPFCVGRVHEFPGRSPEFLARGGLVVRLENAGLRFHDLGQRPERHAVPVCEASALSPGRELLLGVDNAGEFVQQAALADAGDADERHELWRALLAHAVEGRLEQTDFSRAADQLAGHVVEHFRPESRARLDRLPDRDRFGLPLRCDRFRLAVSDRVARSALSGLVHDHTVDGSGALKPCGGIYNIPRRHSLTLGRARAE